MSDLVYAHNNGDCWSPTCPLCEAEEGICQECDDSFEPETGCHHDGRSLCPSCLWRCGECCDAIRDDMAAEAADDRSFR